jgi:phage recombination protein Bet
MNSYISLTYGDLLLASIFLAMNALFSILLSLRLDPFKRVVHIVPLWSYTGGEEGSGGMVETVWPGIAELRTTAFRTGQYAGCDETVFGPDTTRTFKGRAKIKKEWKDVEKTVTFPAWAQITVYRTLHGERVKFVGPKVFWLESYATMGNSDLPNDMWEARPYGQLEKNAEAGALRKAFPEQLGNDLSFEEMDGRRIINIESTRAPVPTPATLEPPPPPFVASQPAPTGNVAVAEAPRSPNTTSSQRNIR